MSCEGYESPSAREIDGYSYYGAGETGKLIIWDPIRSHLAGHCPASLRSVNVIDII